MPLDPSYLGVVRDVKGATISVSLDPSTLSGLVYVDGHGYRIGQVGSFIRIPIGFVDLYGIVSQVGAGAVPERLVVQENHGDRWMTVQLVGEGGRSEVFRRGLSQYPTIGDAVHLVTEGDLAVIYGRPDLPGRVRVGHLASAESIPALIDIDKLVSRHSAVVGTTGAGKSTTVAGLLVSLSDVKKYPSSRILVLDLHGEYAPALRDRANVFRVNPMRQSKEQKLSLPFWAMNFDELVSVVMGAVDEAGKGVLIDRITALKLESLKAQPIESLSEEEVTVDSPIPFSIHKLWFDLHCDMRATFYARPGEQTRDKWALETDSQGQPIQAGDAMRVIPPKFKAAKNAQNDSEKIYLSSVSVNLGRASEALASKLRDPRYGFLLNPTQWSVDLQGRTSGGADLDSFIKSWLGGKQPISILDLSGIPAGIVSDLVGVLLRILYDAMFWSKDMSEGGRENPLLVVLEEAHAYLSHGDSGAASLAVRRIVKEGRKYGIGAMIVSQRPSEIDSTILSQCGTFFAMRLTNSNDRAHIASAVTDNLESLLAMLPVLRTGEAIIVGEAVQLPVRTLIDTPEPDRRPDSRDPRVYVHEDAKNGTDGPGGWNTARKESSNYKPMVLAWRRQQTREHEPNPDEDVIMTRTPVESSSIASVKYDAGNETFEVEFIRSGVYQYFAVPQHVFDAFMSAESKGNFLTSQIKGVYRYARV